MDVVGTRIKKMWFERSFSLQNTKLDGNSQWPTKLSLPDMVNLYNQLIQRMRGHYHTVTLVAGLRAFEERLMISWAAQIVHISRALSLLQ